jgi:hypothetical protein
MKKISIMIVLIVVATGLSQGQDKGAMGFKPGSYYTFSWNTTFTIGDFNKWVGNASPAGFDLGGRYFFHQGWNAGYNISWQRVWQTYGYETYYNAEGSAITATNYRFTWMVPFQAVIAYNFIPDKMVSPYIGLGIGGDYMEHHLLIQEFDIYKEAWDFSLTPEIGALVKFGYYSNWGAVVAFNYKWTTNQIDIYDNKSLKNLQMLNLKVGIAYILR